MRSIYEICRACFHLRISLLLSVAFAGKPGPAPVNAACCYFAARDKDINQPGQKAVHLLESKGKDRTFHGTTKVRRQCSGFRHGHTNSGKTETRRNAARYLKDLAMYTILMPLPEPIYSPLDRQRMLAEDKCCEASAVPGSFPRKEKGSVRVLETGVVGSLDYKIIVADDASGLFDWLKNNHYSYGGDEATLQYYISKKWFFTVMKIDSKQMKKSPDGSYLAR